MTRVRLIIVSLPPNNSWLTLVIDFLEVHYQPQGAAVAVGRILLENYISGINTTTGEEHCFLFTYPNGSQ
jgi:hypothetical protein